MRIVDALGIFPLLVALCLCSQAVASMALPWFRGRPEKVDWLGGIFALPSRYLVDVHEVVARQPKNARMHALLAGGFLASLMLLCVSLVFPASFWLAVPVWFAAIVACFGLWLEYERRSRPAAGLSTGVYGRLPRLFAASMAFVFVMPIARLLDGSVALALSVPAAGLGVYGFGGLARMAGNGPMRHAFAGVANLILHRRPERFGKRRSTGLKAPDLGREPLGVGTIVDFTMPQLASFDACVQCGRCEVACPAFAAGMPLNPKKLVNDLAESLRGKGATSYGGRGYPGLNDGADDVAFRLPLIFENGQVSLAPETIWSCTTCRACVDACPMMIEHVDAIVDLRRAETLQRGIVAPHVQDVLENLRDTDTQGGHELASRFDWAVDLDLGVIREGQASEALLWVGESAFDRRAQRTLRSLVKLMTRAGLKPVILGALERDTGDQARRLGDEATFQRLAKANIETLRRFDFKYIVTADPHVLHTIRNEYPALGGTFAVRHHTDLLAELMEAGRLGQVQKLESAVTYHDPCYLGRYNGEFDAPRRILQQVSSDFIEMEKSRTNSHCCGGGGGAPLSDVPGERRIPDMRMEQVGKTGAGCVAVACPGCTAMLEGVTGASASVVDIAELLEASLEVRP